MRTSELRTGRIDARRLRLVVLAAPLYGNANEQTPVWRRYDAELIYLHNLLVPSTGALR